MAIANYHGSYGFKPDIDVDPRAGGLVRLLQQVMDQQGLNGTNQQQGRQPGPGVGQMPFNPGPNTQSNIAPRWDPTRPFAVPVGPPPQQPPSGGGDASRHGPTDGNNGGWSSAHTNPNFRQLSRRPPLDAQRDDGSSHTPVGQSSRHYDPYSAGNSPDASSASGDGTVSYGAYGANLGPTGAAAGSGMATPVSPVPGPPRIPMPDPRNWSEESQKTWQMDGRTFLGGGNGGGGGSGGGRGGGGSGGGRGGGGAQNGDSCDEEIRNAREICKEAAANDWKSDYGVGPYKTSSGKPWTVQDCMRGLISEGCGGNPVDTAPKKPKIKRYRLR